MRFLLSCVLCLCGFASPVFACATPATYGFVGDGHTDNAPALNAANLAGETCLDLTATPTTQDYRVLSTPLSWTHPLELRCAGQLQCWLAKQWVSTSGSDCLLRFEGEGASGSRVHDLDLVAMAPSSHGSLLCLISDAGSPLKFSSVYRTSLYGAPYGLVTHPATGGYDMAIFADGTAAAGGVNGIGVRELSLDTVEIFTSQGTWPFYAWNLINPTFSNLRVIGSIYIGGWPWAYPNTQTISASLHNVTVTNDLYFEGLSGLSGDAQAGRVFATGSAQNGSLHGWFPQIFNSGINVVIGQ